MAPIVVQRSSFFVLCAVTGVPLSWNKTTGWDVEFAKDEQNVGSPGGLPKSPISATCTCQQHSRKVYRVSPNVAHPLCDFCPRRPVTTDTSVSSSVSQPSSVSPGDAQVSDTHTRVGAWLLVLSAAGQPDISISPWFSPEITAQDWPWIFEKGGKPFLIISTCEALAALLALKVFHQRCRIAVIPTTEATVRHTTSL